MSELGVRFLEALDYSFRLHREQARKGSGTPYIAHLLSVAALVIEDGGDEDEVIAALLHDAVEDQGGWDTLERIRSKFGQRVSGIVEGCTDAFDQPKPPWRERKETYLAHLETAPVEVLRVSSADKLHNARTILIDLQHNGAAIWDRFKGGKTGTLWYYRALVELFKRRYPGPNAEELEAVVQRIVGIAAVCD